MKLSGPFFKAVTGIMTVLLSIVHAATEFPAIVSSSTGDIAGFLGESSSSVHAKLVFINSVTGGNGQLCYIDFSEDVETPVIHKIAAVPEAKVPVISPDGNWVVYATGEGGEAGRKVEARSSVYICRIAEDAEPVLLHADSAAEPRFMQNVPEGVDTVIFSTLSPNFAWEGAGATMKTGVTYEGTTVTKHTPEVLWDKGSFTGGLSWDKQYLCGGGGTAAMLDRKGDGRPDTVTALGQACNVSVTSSRTNTDRIMYLTAGAKKDSFPEIKNGEAWKQWQLIFIGNYDKKILRYYQFPEELENVTDPGSFKSPAQSYCWHHPEWSNHPHYAVATLNIARFFNIGTEDNPEYENTTYQERIFIINLVDSAYIEVLRAAPEVIVYDPDNYNSGAGFYWPWLWVEVPDDFNEESIVEVRIPGREIRPVPSRCTLRGTSLTAAKPIVEIAVFDLSGRRLYASSSFPVNITKTEIPVFENVSANLLYLKVRFSDGTVEMKPIPGF